MKFNLKHPITERFYPNHLGDRYENIEGKRIDFFALDTMVTKQMNFFDQLIEPFYKYPETPVRFDIIIIYNFTKLEIVEHQYKGREKKIKKDGFIFKDPDNKLDAVLGILKITQ